MRSGVEGTGPARVPGTATLLAGLCVAREKDTPTTDITVTTTDGIDGREVTEYLGVVSGEAVVGAAFDYEEMREGMLWVNISGTAVRTR